MAGKKPNPGQILSEKQLKFCREYVLDLNAAQAAVRTGYSEKTAKEQASRLLTNVNVAEEIRKLLKDMQSEAIASATETLETATNILRAKLDSIFDEDGCVLPDAKISSQMWLAIQSIEVFEEFQGAGKDREYIGRTKKIKLWDKNRALETLAKYHRLLTEGSVTNIQVNQQQNNLTQNYAKVVIWLPPKDQ